MFNLIVNLKTLFFNILTLIYFFFPFDKFYIKKRVQYFVPSNRKLNNISYKQYSNIMNNNKLDPWYVTGFADGESCFNIWIARSKSNLIGWQVQARFIIEVNIKDKNLLYKIQEFFGGIGTISITKSVARFAVFGFNDITNVIIKHFDNYPLQSAKKNRLLLVKRVCIINVR